MIAKVIAGEADQKETDALNRWARQKKENKQLIDMMKSNWEPSGHEGERIRVDTDQAWLNLRSRLENDGLISHPPRRLERKIVMPSLWRAAAALVLLAGGAILSYLILTPDAGGVKLAANTAEQQEFGIVLPDGSEVDMNAHSGIEYHLTSSGIRSVKLRGEAWFNVNEDTDHPFVVAVGNGVIRVTGTSFNVRTNPKWDRIEVYVASGSVQFQRSNREDAALSLDPGTMGVLEQNRLMEEKSIDINYLAWKTKKLSFRQTPLGEVADVLDRTYGKNIRFDNEQLEDCLFTGTFDQQPVDSVMKALQIAFGLELEQDNNTFIFSGNGCN